MKYLILIAVVMGVIWWIKLSRSATPPPSPTAANEGPQTMVRCAHCGLHLPQNEAVSSNQAVYCSHAHRELAEHQT